MGPGKIESSRWGQLMYKVSCPSDHSTPLVYDPQVQQFYKVSKNTFFFPFFFAFQSNGLIISNECKIDGNKWHSRGSGV